MSILKFRLLLVSVAVLGAIGIGRCAVGNGGQAASEKERAMRSARRETKMLDTLYKTAIVSVTQTYVVDSNSTAAITTFQPVLKAMKAGKWHEVRLVDGLGDPINPENAPQDDFEKRSIREMLAGKEMVDAVEEADGKAYLRTMTILPMALEKCILCHENYRGKKIVGGISYRMPLYRDGE